MGGLNNFQQYFTAIQKIESESELNIFLSKNQKQIAESFSKAIRLVWSEYEAEQIHQQVWFMSKVGCVFPMVIASILPHAEFGPNDHREDAPHFICIISHRGPNF